MLTPEGRAWQIQKLIYSKLRCTCEKILFCTKYLLHIYTDCIKQSRLNDISYNRPFFNCNRKVSEYE